MRKTKLSMLQKPDGLGGYLSTLPATYRVYKLPVGDESKWGYLAYVSESTKQKILATGFGELDAHIEYIQSRIGQLKKLKMKPLIEQTEMAV